MHDLVAFTNAPQISVQPQECDCLARQLMSFSVVPSGTTPFHYVWNKNGLPLKSSKRVFSVTNATLTISNIVPTDVGSVYRANLQYSWVRRECSSGFVCGHKPALGLYPSASTRFQVLFLCHYGQRYSGGRLPCC